MDLFHILNLHPGFPLDTKIQDLWMMITNSYLSQWKNHDDFIAHSQINNIQNECHAFNILIYFCLQNGFCNYWMKNPQEKFLPILGERLLFKYNEKNLCIYGIQWHSTMGFKNYNISSGWQLRWKSIVSH